MKKVLALILVATIIMSTKSKLTIDKSNFE